MTSAPPSMAFIIVHINSTHEIGWVVQQLRSGARWLILDNRTMALVDSGKSPYVPLLEFEQNGVRQFVSPIRTLPECPAQMQSR